MQVIHLMDMEFTISGSAVRKRRNYILSNLSVEVELLFIFKYLVFLLK